MIDREKYLERQRRYNRSAKGYRRSRRYEDAERAAKVRETYERHVGWLVRMHTRHDAAEERDLGRLKELYELVADEPWAESLCLGELAEERVGKKPERQQWREAMNARCRYWLKLARMREGLIPAEDLGPEPEVPEFKPDLPAFRPLQLVTEAAQVAA